MRSKQLQHNDKGEGDDDVNDTRRSTDGHCHAGGRASARVRSRVGARPSCSRRQPAAAAIDGRNRCGWVIRASSSGHRQPSLNALKAQSTAAVGSSSAMAYQGSTAMLIHRWNLFGCHVIFRVALLQFSSVGTVITVYLNYRSYWAGERSGPEVDLRWTGTRSLRSTSGPALVRSTTGPVRSTSVSYPVLYSRDLTSSSHLSILGT